MVRVVTLVLCLLCATSAAAQSVATVITNAPIFVGPRETATPLRVAAVGTRLRVLAEEGDWIQVEFQDPKYGRRVGYIARRFVGITNQATKPTDLSVPPTGVVTPAPAITVAATAAPVRPLYFPKAETSLGWAYTRLHVPGDTLDVNSALGWNVSFARNLSPWLGIVGDATGNYKTELLDLPEVDGMWHTFVGGPRFSLRISPMVVPFGEFLVGVTMSRVSVLGQSDSFTDFTLQPGGGVDIGNERLAARLGFAWRRVLYEDDATNNYRFVAGVVIRR
jgi:uncharacterized protein YraI